MGAPVDPDVRAVLAAGITEPIEIPDSTETGGYAFNRFDPDAAE